MARRAAARGDMQGGGGTGWHAERRRHAGRWRHGVACLVECVVPRRERVNPLKLGPVGGGELRQARAGGERGRERRRDGHERPHCKREWARAVGAARPSEGTKQVVLIMERPAHDGTYVGVCAVGNATQDGNQLRNVQVGVVVGHRDVPGAWPHGEYVVKPGEDT